jgi:hypothetical protein
MADKKFSEFPVVASPTLADITVVGLDELGQNAQFAGTEFGGGVSAHPDLADRDLPDQHPISAITSLQTSLDGKEAGLGNPASNGYILSSTTGGVRSWIAPGVATWGGILGTLSAQTDLQSALDAKLDASAVSAFGATLIDDADAATARGTLHAAPIAGNQGIPRVTVIVGTGNSQFAGFGAGSNPPTGSPVVTLTANPNVYIWQAATWDTQTASWQNADHSGTPLAIPSGKRMVGYYKGQVGAPYLAMANRIQENEGGIVLLVPTYLGGMPSDVFNPSVGDTDSIINFDGLQTNNNNMWYWHCTAVNNALAAAAAGTGLPAAYAIDHVDIVYCDIASGDAIYTSSYAGASRTMQEANTGFVTNMNAFIAGAEEGVTIGGWAKKWSTRWYSGDVPVGTTAGAGLQQAFANFDGNSRLFSACQSLLWTVPSPTGLLAASNAVMGSSDSIHRNATSQLAMGALAGDMWLNIPQRSSKQSTGVGTNFTASIDAQGYDLTNLDALSSVSVTTDTLAADSATLTVPTTMAANISTPLLSVTGTIAVSGTADSVISGIKSSVAYNFAVPGNQILGGSFIQRADVITASGAATSLPVSPMLYDSTSYLSSVAVVNTYGANLSGTFIPTVGVTGGGTISFGPSYPSITVAEGATLGTGVTSPFHVGIHSRAVTHTGTVGVEAQVWLSNRTSAAQNVGLLIGGTVGTVPTISADHAMWQVSTTPWRFNGNIVNAAGDLTLTSGNLVLTSGNATLTSGGLTLTSGNITMSSGRVIGQDISGAGYINLQPLPSSSTSYFEAGTIFGAGILTWKETGVGTSGYGGRLKLATKKSDNTNTAFEISCDTAQSTSTTLLIDATVGTVSKFKLNVVGAPAFWGKSAPPTTQATAGVGSAGNFVQNLSAPDVAYKGSTWSGGNGTTAYTVNDLVRALKDIGILVL